MVGNEMNIVLENRDLPPLSSGAMAYFGIMSFILGIFLVWFYAALHPRFGPGVKTAVIVSVVVWFLTYFWSNASMVAFGFMPFRLTVIGTAWGLVELLVASAIATSIAVIHIYGLTSLVELLVASAIATRLYNE